jgi:hypothetical protein
VRHSQAQHQELAIVLDHSPQQPRPHKQGPCVGIAERSRQLGKVEMRLSNALHVTLSWWIAPS